jgi:hypothetical protein
VERLAPFVLLRPSDLGLDSRAFFLRECSDPVSYRTHFRPHLPWLGVPSRLNSIRRAVWVLQSPVVPAQEGRRLAHRFDSHFDSQADGTTRKRWIQVEGAQPKGRRFTKGWTPEDI